MKKSTFILPVLFGLGLLAFRKLDTGKYFEIAKNLEIFANAYKELNHSYVDELDPGQLMRRGMDSMLEGLDPFTNYISETDIEGYRYLTEGKYNGLGAQSKRIGDWVVITEIYENSPAHKAGLKVGDAITSVDGQSAKGRSDNEVMEFLRGFPGTSVDLGIRRPGESKDLKIKLIREEVSVPNVPHSGFVTADVGYVNLTTFTRDAGENVANAVRDMKKKNPNLKGIILDLRGNGGGLLTEGVNTANVFLPKNEFIVSTKGKVPEWNRSFKTLNQPVDNELPLVVLIDHLSASASEIVCGSIQDLDRGVIMGQLSYGKGLVQNTKDVGYNAKIKLTTAKYYIPSGRCIQAVRYRDGKPIHIPDNERATFKTRNGRVVLDGGGVKPDVLLPSDTAKGIVKALLDQNIIFDYVTQWVLKNPKIDSIETFTFGDWEQFSQFVQSKNFDFETSSELKIKELRELAAAENLKLDSEVASLENKIKQEKKAELQKSRVRIVREIEQEIVGRYFFQRGKVRKNLKNDPEIEAAVQLLGDPARYRKIIAGK